MSGKLGYYLLFGFIGFLITYAVSAGNNLFMTSFIRGLIAFAVWFLLAFAANWVITFLKEQEPRPDVRDLTDALKEQDKGASLDLTTPDQSEELNDLLKQTPKDQSQTQEFTPLNPPKLVKTLDDKDPEELAKVVRHLTDK
ncbi:hypothetical protein J25TS5_07510 [Paenibacillus faecis]|uniref:Uncharacterized protein n=1 Tax=Paenibacillus faecis TaxID=862114 RepID=A0A5D0CWQ4_9BACL|nr:MULTISPECIES: hypothetical protein [Paenibacillus]MCA1294200.1 hypothetical protein [Paenibacillus sp. alder61]TYA14331.1 hypothetical protein FRY98_01175 [Paenibacillus faecis]GIO83819.1 hypothetical protein J25TS5_07510 [Paenibacillus faecis]